MICVSAAVIIQEGLCLICRRADGEDCAGLWEFPGGKQKPDETAQACLRRECWEELDIDIRVGPLLKKIDWKSHGQELCISFFEAAILAGVPCCRVHTEIRWAEKQLLHAFSFCPADAQIANQLSSEP